MFKKKMFIYGELIDWIDELIDSWMDRLMLGEEWIDGWRGGWKDEWVDTEMNYWIDRWMLK